MTKEEEQGVTAATTLIREICLRGGLPLIFRQNTGNKKHPEWVTVCDCIYKEKNYDLNSGKGATESGRQTLYIASVYRCSK